MRQHASDPDARIGFTNDPAEVLGWCAWLQLGHYTLYLYPRSVKTGRRPWRVLARRDR